MKHTWQECADEFGRLTKQGKDVRLALLVACSVEKGTAGRPKKIAAIAAISNEAKVSARRFAERAGLPKGADRVLRHLDAWDEFAKAQGLPIAADLTPDDAYTLDITEEQAEAFGKVRLTPEPEPPDKTGPAAAKAINANPSEATTFVKGLTKEARDAVVEATLVSRLNDIPGVKAHARTDVPDPRPTVVRHLHAIREAYLGYRTAIERLREQDPEGADVVEAEFRELVINMNVWANQVPDTPEGIDRP
jgi:hypothetical protein